MRLRILTWNLGFGYGPGSDGLGGRYRTRPASHFDHALNEIARVIKTESIDIALLQEVDFDAARSHHIHQLDQISRKSGLLHRAPVVSWNSMYVPYPGLDPRTHFGRIRSGGGILSRFPIHPILSDLLAKPREKGRLRNFFSLHRYLQIVSIEGLRICNLHLEAFSAENRELHLIRLQDRLRDLDLDLAGGDFNGEAILGPETQALYEEPSQTGATFPSDAPDVLLDRFLLRKNKFQKISIRVLPTGTVSDHLPVLLEADFIRA